MIEHVSTLTPEESTFPSDHYLVNFSIWLKFKRARCVQRKAYNYKRADFQDLHRLLQNATLDIPLSYSINISWSWWKDLFLAAVEKCVPVKVIKDTNSPPWIDGEIRHLNRKTRFEEHKKKLRSLSNYMKILVRRKHRDYLHKIQGSFSENPKLFWNYHKAVLHHRSGVVSIITSNGITAKTPAEKAELFNTYFCSVFTSLSAVSSLPSSPIRSDIEIC
jgi:hypothetical protein